MLKIKKKAVLEIAFFLLLVCFLPLATQSTGQEPWGFSKIPFPPAGEVKQLEPETSNLKGTTIRLEEGKISLELTDLRLKGSQSTKGALVIPNLRLEMDSSSLLRGELRVQRLILRQPTVPIVRNQEGKFYLLGHSFSQLMKKGNGGRGWKLGPLSLKQVAELEIQRGQVRLVDHAVHSSPVKVTAMLDLVIKGISSDTPWHLDGKGHLETTTSKEKASFKIGGTLASLSRVNLKAENLDIQLLRPFVSSLRSLPVLEGFFDATMEAQGKSLRDFHSWGKLKFHPLHFYNPRVFQNPFHLENALLTYRFLVNPKGFNLRELTLGVGELSLNGRLFAQRLPTGKWKIDTQVSSSPFDFEEARPYLPWKVFNPKFAKFLNKNVWGGTVTSLTLNTKGKVEELRDYKEGVRQGLYTGGFTFQGPSYRFHDELPPVKNVKGVAILKEGKLFFQEMTGIWQTSLITQADGILTLYMNKTPLDITIDLQIDMEELRETALKPTKKPLPSPLPLLALLDRLEGQADLRLRFEGQTERKYPKTFSGKLSLRGGSLSRGPLPLPFSHLHGVIFFTPDRAETQSITGKMGSSLFALQGKLAYLQSPAPALDIQITTSLETRDLKAFLPAKFKFPKVSPIPFDFNLSLQGTTRQLQIRQEMSLDPISQKFNNGQTLSPGRDRFTLDGVFLQEQEPVLVINQAHLSLLSSKIQIQGKVYFITDQPQMQLSVLIPKLNIFQLLQIAYNPNGYGKDASLEGELDLEGPWANLEELQMKGQLKAHGQELFPTFLAKPLDKVEALLDFDGKQIQMRSTLAQGDRPPLSLTADFSWAFGPRFSFWLSGRKLDLDDLISQDIGFAQKADFFRFLTEQTRENPVFHSFREGRIQVDALQFRGTTFQNTRFSLVGRKETLEVEELELEINGGLIHLQGTLHAPQEIPSSLSSTFWVRGLDAETFLRPFRLKRHLLSGNVSLSGNLSATGESNSQALHSLNGDLSLGLIKGRLHRLSWLSKIFSLLNIYQLVEARFPDIVSEGMPFDWIKGDFTLKEGTAHTQDLLISSPSMNMSAVGDVHLAQNALNLVVGVQPLQTFARVVGLVPFANYILLGEEKRLLVAYFNVNGNISSPGVTPRPVDTLSKGILGIVQRTLTLPFVLPRRIPDMINESLWENIWKILKREGK